MSTPSVRSASRRAEKFGLPPVVLACTAIGVAFLATRLLLVWRFPPFLDEARHAAWTVQGFEDIHYRFISLTNGKEPLLTWLGMGWMLLGAEPLTAVRLVSVASGLVTVVMVGLIARHFWGDRVAVVAAALCAVLPFFVVHDAIGIMESLVTAAAMCALYLQIRFAAQPALDLALLLGFALAAGLLTKETGQFALVLLPLSLLCFGWRRRPGVGARLAAWVGGAALALLMAGIGYSILMLSDYWDDLGTARRAIDMHRPVGEALSRPWQYAGENAPLFVEALAGYVTVPLLLLFVLGAVVALRDRPPPAALLLGWALFPLATAFLLAYVAYPRYIVIAVPPIVVFVALGLVRLWEWTAARQGTVVATAAAVLLAVPALVFDSRVVADPAGFRYPALDDEQFATGWTAGRAWEDVADELERRAGSRPTFVQLGERNSPALELLLRDRPNIRLTTGSHPLGPAAAYAIENGDTLSGRDGLLDLRPVWETRRPRGGTALRLLVRGPVWEGRFYSTPDDLRAGLGLPDPKFDAFLASHPEVLAWYRAWYGALSAGAR